MTSDALLNRWDEFTPLEGIGTAIRNLEEQDSENSIKVLRATYDFSVLGGAEGSVSLKDPDGEDAVLPINSLIKKVYIDVITDPTSGGSATIALNSEGAGDLLAATAFDSYTGTIDGDVDGAAANMVKTTAARTVQATIADATLTAGKFHVFIEYLPTEATSA